eukprot:CCRYP_003868-RA/>CCRYP_003868-RA protein AED:0.07 eAED:0.07 QI:238/1/1/1/1/1/3/208/406
MKTSILFIVSFLSWPPALLAFTTPPSSPVTTLSSSTASHIDGCTQQQQQRHQWHSQQQSKSYQSTFNDRRIGVSRGGARRSSSSSSQMFTGIVEEMGEVVSLETKDDIRLWDGTVGRGTEMVVRGDVVLEGAYLGCSISVNGVCLTATELDFDNKQFKVGLAPETLRKTNLGTYDPSSQNKKYKAVNLERASEIGGRNSGHFVQGHVDNVGRIIDQWVDDNSLFFKVSFPSEFMRYIVPKGFIAIDGTSLTVCDVHTGNTPEENWFTFMLVEYTQKKIILPFKGVGDTVNVEVDVLGKYSERAWEVFVPKMEELEQKVRELEGRLRYLEGREDGGDGSASTGDDLDIGKTSEAKSVTYGDIIPQSLERKNSEPDGDVTDGMAAKSKRTWARPRDDPTLEWVRIQGG